MSSYKKSISPAQIKDCLPPSTTISKNVMQNRQAVIDILNGDNERLIMIIGPCSFHDANAALAYARKLKLLAASVSEKIFVMMRVYFEKPRTNTGWKGYLNDPELNSSFCIEKGIFKARQFMLQLSEMNLPIATEILNPYAYLYFEDLLNWAAIGARTSESQPHREVASGTVMPVGFKNAISGDLESAALGISFASRSHVYLGMNPEGNVSMVRTQGNPNCHLILRGGKDATNYQAENIKHAEQLMDKVNIPRKIIIDCSHGNSLKNASNQKIVLDDIISQLNCGNQSIKGVMIESFLNPGNQALSLDAVGLKYGISITDACIGWNSTESLVMDAFEKLNSKKLNSPNLTSYLKYYSENFPMAF